MHEGRDDTDPTRAADVADAMRVLARERFLPPEQRARAHEDRALPLWHGQTGSQPSTVASMLRLLQVPVGARVLDVGSGSGWTTALLARLVGPDGVVLGLELDPELAAWGAANLDSCDLPWARIEQATPGTLGRPVEGGWDRILVSASPKSLPTVLVEQLAEGGRMVIPVRSTMHLVERAAGRTRVTTHGSYTFVPLR
jgi:protein-L-isoaspartate(D-aspartate) O-methyltransferase